LRNSVLLSLVVAASLLALQTPPTAFIDVTVVPMDRERLPPHQTVLVQAGRSQQSGRCGKSGFPETYSRSMVEASICCRTIPVTALFRCPAPSEKNEQWIPAIFGLTVTYTSFGAYPSKLRNIFYASDHSALAL